jgi:hypothetical protein
VPTAAVNSHKIEQNISKRSDKIDGNIILVLQHASDD